MTNLHKLALFLFTFLLACTGCTPDSNPEKGTLFIIGGGSRPTEMINDMLRLADLQDSEYIVVLPFSSSVPKEASEGITEQFSRVGHTSVFSIHTGADSLLTQAQKDTILNAGIIYITGGDQNKFMGFATKNRLKELLQQAYNKGSMIAGTSAGAAVMSERMITGNAFKYEKYTGEYPTIEANNIEISEGLGFLQNSIIDQHFIKRQRLNRLVSVSLENPGIQCIGIDESTAIFVSNGKATVYGENQVIILNNKTSCTSTSEGLLGGIIDEFSILLPGETFPVN